MVPDGAPSTGSSKVDAKPSGCSAVTRNNGGTTLPLRYCGSRLRGLGWRCRLPGRRSSRAWRVSDLAWRHVALLPRAVPLATLHAFHTPPSRRPRPAGRRAVRAGRCLTGDGPDALAATSGGGPTPNRQVGLGASPITLPIRLAVRHSWQARFEEDEEKRPKIGA